MRAIDENSDGQVSLDEYVTLVRATLDRVLRILKGEDVDDDIAASARRSL